MKLVRDFYTSTFQERTVSLEHCVGIDVARILAMFLVCWGHVVFLGDFISQTTGECHIISIFINVLTGGCVDLFALISGFVGLYARCRISSWFRLWLLTFFYNIVIRICHGDGATLLNVYGIAPIYGNVYWYFTAYSGLFFIMPILNDGIRHLSRSGAIKILMAIFFIALTTVTGRDLMYLHNGYSFVWLVMLYIVGAIERRFSFFNKPIVAANVMFAFIVGAFVLTLLLPRLRFVSYTSPLILGAMVCVVDLFAHMKFSVGPFSSMVGKVSSCMFAVYLIHVHPVLFLGRLKCYCIGLRQALESLGAMGILVGSFCFAVAIMLGCLFVEFVRRKLVSSLMHSVKALKLTRRG